MKMKANPVAMAGAACCCAISNRPGSLVLLQHLLHVEIVESAMMVIHMKWLLEGCQRPDERARGARRVRGERAATVIVVRERRSEMKKVIVNER